MFEHIVPPFPEGAIQVKRLREVNRTRNLRVFSDSETETILAGLPTLRYAGWHEDFKIPLELSHNTAHPKLYVLS